MMHRTINFFEQILGFPFEVCVSLHFRNRSHSELKKKGCYMSCEIAKGRCSLFAKLERAVLGVDMDGLAFADFALEDVDA